MDKTQYSEYSSKKILDEMIRWTIFIEGGYVNDPRDPGLATKYGISARFNPEVRESIINGTFTKQDAYRIYEKKYITNEIKALVDLKFPSLAYGIFDAKVSGHFEVVDESKKLFSIYSKMPPVKQALSRGYDNGFVAITKLLNNRAHFTEYQFDFLKHIFLNRMQHAIPRIAKSAAIRTMASQKRLRLKSYDYTKGFINRGKKRYGFMVFLEEKYAKIIRG